MRAVRWRDEVGVPMVRYEDLKRQTLRTLRRFTREMTGRPAGWLRLRAAAKASSIDQVRNENKFMQLHCRKGEVGGWRRELDERHLELLKTSCAHVFEALDYPIDF